MEKGKHLLVKLLAVSFACCLVSAVGVSCNKKPNTDSSDSSVENYQESGSYYYISGDTEYSISLDEGEFTLSIAGQVITGSYTYNGSELTLLVDGSAYTSAQMRDGVIVLTYEGTEYTFEKMTLYTVSFSADGKVVDTVRVKSGETVAKPADPEKEDNVFAGWYTDDGFAQADVYYFNTPVTGDITLYARFVEAMKGPFEFTVEFDAGYDGADPIAPMETVEGKVYNLPQLERDGYDFAGWWMSDADSADKLTAKYEEQTIEENITLYAVWRDSEDASPLVSAAADKITWTAKGINNRYTVTIKDAEGNKVGETTTTSTSYAFDFASQAAGEYQVTVAVANGESATVYYQNKMLAKVCLFEVEGNVLKFNPVAGAESYNISIDCGTAGHEHQSVDLGDKTIYDFSDCDMKEGGIVFSVTASADGYISSQSAEYVFERHLEKIATIVKDDATETVSWEAVENAVSYRVIVSVDGEEVFNGDIGNQLSYNLKTYAAGEVVVQVVPVAKGYNSPEATEYGYTKARVATPVNVRVDGSDIVWDSVDGATGYIVSIGGTVREVAGTRYTLTEDDYVEGTKEYKVTVTAKGAAEANNSVASDVLVVRSGEMGEEIYYSNGKVSWDPVFGGAAFYVKVNDGAEVKVTNATSYAVTFAKAGANTISVCVESEDGFRSSWVSVTVNAYTITFDACEGSAVTSIYKAEGDSTVELPDSARTGYNFSGWYTAPGGSGTRYDAAGMAMGGKDITLYAAWTPKEYKITFDVGMYSEDVLEPELVAYDQSFTLSTPSSNNILKAFAGWYTDPNGQGIRITDFSGKSEGVWKRQDAMTVYAYWVDVFEFTQIQGGYSVSKGTGINYVKEVTIPEEYNGQPVTTVNTFASSTNLEVINIPDTIKLISLGSSGTAFLSCNALKEVNIIETGHAVEKMYTSADGVLFNASGTEILYFPIGKGGVYRIPDGVTTISDNLFSRARGLEEVIIPASVTSIGMDAFRPASTTASINPISVTLKKVTFLAAEEGVEEVPLTIESGAFSNCKALEEITLPSRLTNFSSADVFAGCTSIQNVYVSGKGGNYSSVDGVLCVASDAGKVIAYYPSGRTDSYRIPVGDGVIGVGNAAFSSCAGITEIIIPGGVTLISESAFSGCTGLLAVTFEGTATDNPLTIEESAFYGCTGLTSVTLPENLVTLGENAFGNTSSLTKVYVESGAAGTLNFSARAFATTGTWPRSYVVTVYLGVSVPVIDVSGIFGGYATALQSVIVADGNQNYSSSDGVLFDKAATTIVFYPKGKEGDYVVPETVTTIGANVFQDRTLLTKITIGGNVAEIGDYAFEGCSRLSEVVFTGDSSVALTVGQYAFANCDSIVSFAFPVRTTNIGGRVFYSSNSLTNVTIPEGVVLIGKNAFTYTNIQSITLPSTLTYLSAEGTMLDVFQYCYELREVIVAEGNPAYASIDGVLYRKTVIDAQAEEKQYYISDLMFCPIAKTGIVDVPPTVRQIWECAFQMNEGVTEIKFSKGLTEVTDASGKVVSEATLALGAKAFYSCTALAKVELPSGVTSIGEYTFYTCAALKEITIPNTVSVMESMAFYRCTGLSTVTFETGNESMELRLEDASSSSGVFDGCSAIESITLPERTTYVGKYAFSDCLGLKVVNIPASVTEIQGYAFYHAPIEEVNFAAGSKLTTIGDYAFRGSVITEISLPEGLKTIGASAFQESKLTKIVIPASVELIDMAAFEYCVDLKELTFADKSKLKEFGNSACLGCTSLEKVDFGKRAKKDDAGAPLTLYFDRQGFKWCSSLKSIVIPADTTEIGLRMFEGCFALESVTFGEGDIYLETIQDNAFWATAIEEFVFPESATGGTFDLGSGLFKACASLKKVTLSNSVVSIDDVFTGCLTLESIIIPEGHANFTAGETPIIYNQDGKAIMVVYGNAADSDGKITIAAGTREIGASAFAGRDDIVSVVIPSSVEVIGKNAFKGCVNLKEVIFEDGSLLSSLGDYAFQNCTSLEKVVLPASYASLPNYLFDGCKSLREVTLPADLTTVGNYVFRNCSSLPSISLPNTISKVGTYMFSGCSSLAEVNFNGNTVLTAFGNYIFQNCTSLKTIALPEQLESLGTYAFSGSGLTEIDLSKLSNLKYLGTSATACSYSSSACTFMNCADLQKVILPATLTRIGGKVFQNCASLTDINLEDCTQLEMLANYSFQNTGLTSVVVPGIKTAANFGTYVFADCVNLKEVTFQEGLTRISNYAFQNCVSLEEIVLPGTLTTLQGSLFRDCTSLKKVTIPSKITTFGTYIFAGCTNLSEVVFSGTGLQKLGNYMFMDCVSLKTIKLPDTINFLGTYTFQNSGLTEIDLSNTKLTCFGSSATGCTTSANAYVFRGCIELTKVVLPEALTKIGNSVFEGCTKLTDINLENVTQINKYAFSGTALTAISLDSATFVGDEAFAETAITSLSIPQKLTSIGAAAFGGCQSLSRITVESGNANYYAADDVLYTSDGSIVCYPAGKATDGEVVITGDTGIGTGAFAGCLQIEKVVISEGITSIGDYAFYGSGIKEAVLPEGLTEIGDYAFYGCAIESITLPDTLASIGAYAFAESGLKSVTVPASVETIGDYAFAYSALESLDMRMVSPVKSISSSGTITYAGYLFSGCELLTTVTLPEGLPVIAGRMFQDCVSLTEITIPESVTKIDQYAFSGSGIKNFVIPETIEYVGNYAFANSAIEEVTINITSLIASVSTSGTISYTKYAFQNCASLSKVNLCEGFEYIGQYMFAGCTSLESITLPNTMKTIATRAFSGSGLKSIVLPDSMRDTGTTACIGTYVFENCTALTSVQLPANLEIISSSLFYGCSALTSLVLPSSIRDINTDSFYGCTSLTDIVIPAATYEMAAAFEGWTKEQTIYCEISEGQAYSSWTVGWEEGCNATFVFGYTGEEGPSEI